MGEGGVASGHGCRHSGLICVAGGKEGAREGEREGGRERGEHTRGSRLTVMYQEGL